MHIKPQTVLPAGIKIIRLPPSNKKVRSLYSLEKEHERKLAAEAELKAKSDEFTQLLKSGYTVVEALKLISG